jgi:uncharacterized phage protein (TIGR02220 family)
MKDQELPKTRNRFRKIEVRMWGDEKFCRLTPIPPCGQGLWVFLLTGPHTGPIPGVFRSGRAAMAEELNWEMEAFDKAFAEAFREGLVKADWKSKVVWIPNAIKCNRPESPNVVRSWGSEWDLIPECDLKREVYDSLKANICGLGEAFEKAFFEAFGKASLKPSAKPSGKTCANQEQEQEQEKEKQLSGNAADLFGEGSGEGDQDGPEIAETDDSVREVIDYLNKRAGSTFRLVDSNVRLVKARINEGASVEQIKAVIDAKDKDWPPGNEYRKYLRPSTLFNATRFEQYLGQLPTAGKRNHSAPRDARYEN